MPSEKVKEVELIVRDISKRSEGFEEVVHAPTVAVSLLRQAASVVEAAAEQLPEETIFFPPREEGESQPMRLEGHRRLEDIGNLIHYIADMLAV